MIQYTDGPEAYSTEDLFHETYGNYVLMLKCYFDGFPTPSVTWLHNNTVLSESSSIVISNTDGITVLKVTVRENSGGLYTCKFNISDDYVSVNVTTIRLLCEFDILTDR